jgi:hypothetical protein
LHLLANERSHRQFSSVTDKIPDKRRFSEVSSNSSLIIGIFVQASRKISILEMIFKILILCLLLVETYSNFIINSNNHPENEPSVFHTAASSIINTQDHLEQESSCHYLQFTGAFHFSNITNEFLSAGGQQTILETILDITDLPINSVSFLHVSETSKEEENQDLWNMITEIQFFLDFSQFTDVSSSNGNRKEAVYSYVTTLLTQSMNEIDTDSISIFTNKLHSNALLWGNELFFSSSNNIEWSEYSTVCSLSSPTGQPSGQPSSQPSSQPTSSPTTISHHHQHHHGGNEENFFQFSTYWGFSSLSSLSSEGQSCFLSTIANVLDVPLSSLHYDGIVDSSTASSTTSSSKCELKTTLKIFLSDYEEFQGNTTKVTLYLHQLIKDSLSSSSSSSSSGGNGNDENIFTKLLKKEAKNHNLNEFDNSNVYQVDFNAPFSLDSSSSSSDNTNNDGNNDGNNDSNNNNNSNTDNGTTDNDNNNSNNTGDNTNNNNNNSDNNGNNGNSVIPSASPVAIPTETPSSAPIVVDSVSPSFSPSAAPTELPSFSPSETPSVVPTASPSAVPSASPSAVPSFSPSFHDIPSSEYLLQYKAVFWFSHLSSSSSSSDFSSDYQTALLTMIKEIEVSKNINNVEFLGIRLNNGGYLRRHTMEVSQQETNNAAIVVVATRLTFPLYHYNQSKTLFNETTAFLLSALHNTSSSSSSENALSLLFRQYSLSSSATIEKVIFEEVEIVNVNNRHSSSSSSNSSFFLFSLTKLQLALLISGAILFVAFFIFVLYLGYCYCCNHYSNDNLSDKSTVTGEERDTYAALGSSSLSSCSFNNYDPEGPRANECIVIDVLGDYSNSLVNDIYIMTPPASPNSFSDNDIANINPFGMMKEEGDSYHGMLMRMISNNSLLMNHHDNDSTNESVYKNDKSSVVVNDDVEDDEVDNDLDNNHSSDENSLTSESLV